MIRLSNSKFKNFEVKLCPEEFENRQVIDCTLNIQKWLTRVFLNFITILIFKCLIDEKKF